MKKIRSKRQFFAGVLATVLAVVCMVVAFFDVAPGQSGRFVISAVVFLVLAAVNYYWAYSKKGLVEEIQGAVDERDYYLAMKSCQAMVQIMNYLLLGGCFVSLVLYGAMKLSVFLVIAITLCVVLVLMFVLMLVVNGYYEKNA